MKAKLGQNAGDGRRLLVGKLNPNPFTNHLGQFKEVRCFTTEQRQLNFSVSSFDLLGAIPDLIFGLSPVPPTVPKDGSEALIFDF